MAAYPKGGRLDPPQCSPWACGGSPHELGKRDVQGVSKEQQVLQVGHALCVLPSVDRSVVPADEFAELDLGEVRVQAGIPDACPDLPAAGVYPVGHGVEWHPATL